MQKITDYQKWVGLAEREKEKELFNWNIYAGEGKDILYAAIRNLHSRYKNEKEVIKITDGVYHGGIWVICIIIKKGSKVKIPSKYEGFLIMKSHEKLES